MATDEELRRLINSIANGPLEAARIMDSVLAAIQRIADESGIDPDSGQLRQVAQSLVPKLAKSAWPDSASTSFEIPIPRPEQ